MNPKLRLLVSSPCYHKMCESCIDRLFTLGPAPCPICNTVLRKLAFTPQTFEDLDVEKEVSIRKRLAREFNKRREDFADVGMYNDYLEETEDIAFNMINGIDLPQTEARIAAYRAENAAVIELNIQRERDYAQALKDQEENDRKERELRAAEQRREEEDERQEREKHQREIIDRLETSSKDAAKVVAKARKKHIATSRQPSATTLQSNSRLLRSRAAQSTVPDVPHVPLQDDWYAYEDMFELRPSYDDPYSEAVRRDKEGIMRGGGYVVQEAWERALRSAVAGLTLEPLVGLPQAPDASPEPAPMSVS